MQTLDEWMLEATDSLLKFRENYLALNKTDRENYPCERNDGFWEDFIVYIDAGVPREES